MEKTIKNEISSDCGGILFCHACLSTNRTLSVVTDYVDIFYKICAYQDVILPATAHFCWECVALLKKVKMFSLKVTEAQRILQFCLLNKQNQFPHSLTSLTSSLVDHSQIQLTHEEKEIKVIKQEADDDHFDSYDFVYSINNVKDEQDHKLESTKLDSDDVIETKNEEAKSGNTDIPFRIREEFSTKINEKRKAKYRFVNAEMKKHRRYLIRTIPVNMNEVLPVLEKERKSVDFLKADYKCVDCLEVFKDEEGLLRHFKKYHDVSLGQFVCEICRSRFPTSSALLTHSSKHGVRRECRVCGELSMAAGTMARHVKIHHRIVQCICCELFFKNVRLFYMHYKALHGRFVCDVCGKRCKSREIIEKHLRSHFGYECPYCKKVLKNSSSYNNHVECQHTNSFSDDAYCVPCDRRFKNVKLYKRHLMDSSAHARERECNRYKRKFPCPECSNVYSRRAYMNNHYRHVHSKQSKHYCADCDRHFLNRTRLVEHRRFKHEGARRDKDKLCNICGRGFAANRTLVNHIRTHSGERPFGCEQCGARFTQRHAMLAHAAHVHARARRARARD